MSEITIYHNNRCGKSRGALALIQEQGIAPNIRFYLQEAPSPSELKTILHKLEMKAEELVRKNESLYKEKYKGKDISEEEWLQILSDNPILIERPIVINGDRAVVARPSVKVLEILG